MDYLKGLNVIILSLLLILTGCFGMLSDDEEDSVEAESTDDTTTVSATLTAQDIADAMILASNSPPKISVKAFDFTDDDDDGYPVITKNSWAFTGQYSCVDESDMLDEDGNNIGETLEEQRESIDEALGEDRYRHLANLVEVGDCILYFDFLSVDPDGDAMTKGIDTDFDGIIDVPITPNFGVTMVSVDNSTVKKIFNGLSDAPCSQIDVAFIAIDEHGASTAEFMHFIGYGSCELNDDDDEDDNNLDFFTFSATDAPGSDGAAIVTMDSGYDLIWSDTTIMASVDGSPTVSVVQCAEGEYENCWSSSDSETDYWNVGEAILIDTSCTSVCTVTITITDDEGVIFDTVMVDVE